MTEAQKRDARIPLAIMFAAALQTAAVIFWVGAASERLDQLEQRLEAHRDVSARLARLEEKAVMAQVGMDRIEAKLNRALEDPERPRR